MRLIKLLVLAGAILMGTARLQASPFNPKHVPAAAKWVLHVDMDALRETEMWKIIDPQLQKQPGFAQGVQDVEAIAGLQFPQGLHDVTIYGTGFTEDTVAIVLHASMDETRLLTAIQSDPQYTAAHRGTRDVHGWHDKGKPLFGAFCGEGVAVISGNVEAVNGFVDVLDGKTETLKADIGLANGAKPGIMAYLAGEGLAQLKQAKTPLLADVQLAWFSAGEKEKDLVLRASVTTKDAKTAEQMKATVDGMKAFLGLASRDEKADPNVKMLAGLLQNLTTKVSEKTVVAECPIALDAVKELMEKIIAQHAAQQ